MSRSKPTFFKQETRYSCAPACLRMVLSAFGVPVDEGRLRQLADCSPMGTDAFQIVEAARYLGFSKSRKHTLASIDELAGLLDEGVYPIVYVDLWPIKGGLSGQYHSLVVVEINQTDVVVLDPIAGERSLSREDVQVAWMEMHFLVIIIEA